MLNATHAKLIEAYKPNTADPYLIDVKIDLLLLLAEQKLAVEWHVFSANGATPASTPTIDPIGLRQVTELMDKLGILYDPLGPAVIERGQPPLPYAQRVVYRLALTEPISN